MLSRSFFKLDDERGIFHLSISMTILIAIFGIIMGLAARSASIIFDGIYSSLDAVMSLLSLTVVKLILADTQSGDIPEKLQRRFSFGFWHLEPLILMINGTLLISVAVYAITDAVSSILNGGTTLHMKAALFYAAFSLVISLIMVVIAGRANRKIQSALIALDIKGWLIAAYISAALLIAFGAASLLHDTYFAWFIPYADPVVLLVVCVAILPMPIKTVRAAIREILKLTPKDLYYEVHSATRAFIAKHGFTDYRAYVGKKGRSREISVFIVYDDEKMPRSLKEWDSLRDELGDAIGNKGPDRWLTITFISDIRWAE